MAAHRLPRRASVALVVALAAVCVAAAQGPSGGSPNALFGGNEWVVTALATPEGEVALAHGAVASFVLSQDGALAGTSGCNRLIAPFTLAQGTVAGDGSISFGPVIATRMACPEPLMSQESAILQALEHVERYGAAENELVLSGAGYRLVLVARSPRGAVSALPGGAALPGDALAHGAAVAGYAAAFNEAVAAAAAAGAPWPSDPIRVALAFLELKGAPNTIITRSDVGAEMATTTVVTVVEDGFLDDSVAGLEQVTTLALADGVWRVVDYQGRWYCRRPAGSSVALPGVCQ